MDYETIAPFLPRDVIVTLIFCIGYLFIALEHLTKVNKATVALLMAVVCWVFVFLDTRIPFDERQAYFMEHIATTAQIILFLLGALGIVELISVHHGFSTITTAIHVHSSKLLLWIVGLITFFLSAVLDNLTTTIVMVTLIQKLLRTHEQRMLMGGAIVIVANAGGAWSPIGDVTTTMLWIGGNVTTWPLISSLFLPSFICGLAAIAWLHFSMPELPLIDKETEESFAFAKLGKVLFYLGIGSLMFVPVLRYLTGLPPFMGVILGLGLMWMVTDLVHRNYHHHVHLTMPAALSRIDFSSVLFFLGILLSIQALDTVGVLDHLAVGLQHYIGNVELIAVAIGILSAVIDNVPLVAGSMGMYDLTVYPPDSPFWQLVAFCAGTGGSMLIIGSAAGVAYMGLEKVSFVWYLKKIGPPAAIGYFAGILVYLLQ